MTYQPKVFIVEDMAISRMALESILIDSNYCISGSSANAEIAFEELQKTKIDLFLIDINLAGEKDGIWLANQIRLMTQIPIIFITAYGDDKTLENVKATKPNGYIMKPYNTPTLLTTIALVLQNYNDSNSVIINNYDLTNEHYIYIKVGVKQKKIKTSDIYFIMSDANYLHIMLEHKVYLVRDKLSDFCSALPQSEFTQVHRRYVINKNHIESFGQKKVIINNHEISVSKSFRDLFTVNSSK